MKTKTKVIRFLLEEKEPVTIRQISQAIRADYRITHTAVQRLLHDKVLNSREVGGSRLCSLDPSYYGIEMLQAEEERRKEVLKEPNLYLLHKELTKTLGTSMYILLLYGNFAKKERKPYAEINLLCVTNNPRVKNTCKNILALIPLPIQAFVVSEDEFRQLRHNPGENHVKEAIACNVILHGLDAYYHLKSC